MKPAAEEGVSPTAWSMMMVEVVGMRQGMSCWPAKVTLVGVAEGCLGVRAAR
jgi:hypothetical protein